MRERGRKMRVTDINKNYLLVAVSVLLGGFMAQRQKFKHSLA